MTQPKQAPFNLRHAFDLTGRYRCGLERRVKLLTQQVLDVVNEQLLVLHLVFEA